MRYLDKSFNLDFDAIGRESVNSLTTIVRILRLQKKKQKQKKNMTIVRIVRLQKNDFFKYSLKIKKTHRSVNYG